MTETAWCAIFIKLVFKEINKPHTGEALARSF
jgi:hypothetical protein